MTERKVIQTDKAPKAIGPYSQALLVGNTLYISGQLGMNPATGKLVEGGTAAQAKQALENIMAILVAANMNMHDVVQVQVFLADISDFAAVNEVYKMYFREPYPARAAFQVAALPAGAKVEILATAVKN
jgi:2-iminobutanoate/2-iminopropanoate deaminase